MSIPPAASMTPAWFAEAAPVACAGPEVVGPTGVAVAEPPSAVLVTTVPLPLGEGPPLGPGPPVAMDVKVVTAVPEGVVKVIGPTVEVTMTEDTELVGTVETEDDVTVVVGVQSGRVKVPL